MITEEIWWDDLTPEAQERLKVFYHENIDCAPLACIELEDEESEEEEEE